MLCWQLRYDFWEARSRIDSPYHCNAFSHSECRSESPVRGRKGLSPLLKGHFSGAVLSEMCFLLAMFSLWSLRLFHCVDLNLMYHRGYSFISPNYQKNRKVLENLRSSQLWVSLSLVSIKGTRFLGTVVSVNRRYWSGFWLKFCFTLRKL